MGVNERVDRSGKVRVFVDKRWPDGSQLRRVVANKTQGKALLTRIEESIVMGTWRDLKEELARKQVDRSMTVNELAEIYLEHCKATNRAPKFKIYNVPFITRMFGNIPVQKVNRSHLNEFIRRRSAEVKPATVNRGLAIFRHMMSFAVEQGVIEHNPLSGTRNLSADEPPLHIMTLEEERRLVECAFEVHPVIGAFVGILGETAARKNEGLTLTWDRVHLADRYITLERTKNTRVRHVPLTDTAVECFMSLPRVPGVPEVFLKGDGTPWKALFSPFGKAREKAGLPWVRIHDLRHFRATQWVKNGVDLKTVQELLGHRNIQTTMRYARYSQEHAEQSVLRVEKIERGQLEKGRAKEA